MRIEVAHRQRLNVSEEVVADISHGTLLDGHHDAVIHPNCENTDAVYD